MKQAGYSGLAQRSVMSSGKRKTTMTQEKAVEMPKEKRYRGVHEIMADRGKQTHPTIDDAIYHLGFAKTNSSA